MRTSPTSSRWKLLLTWLIVTVSAHPLYAINWDGGGLTDEWLDPNNWVGNVLPGSGDTATIINGTATITGTLAGPVQTLEVGFGISPGTLQLNGNGNIAELDVLSTTTIGPFGELELGTAITDFTSFGQIFNNGEVRVSTGGKLTSSGATGKYTQNAGETRLLGGEVQATNLQFKDGLLSGNGDLTGNVFLGGGLPNSTPTLSPGVGGFGQLDIDGNLELTSKAEYFVEIDASGPTIVADLVTVNGTANLGGTLNFKLIAGSIGIGERVDILLTDGFKAGSAFDEITGLETENGGLIVVFDFVGSRVSPPGISVYETTKGDMNGDGGVDGLDAELFAWAIRDANSYEEQYVDSNVDVPCTLAIGCKAASFFMADMDNDRRQTFADITDFLERVNQKGGNAAEAGMIIANVLNQAVPEPATAWLAVAALTILGVSRPRTKRFAEC